MRRLFLLVAILWCSALYGQVHINGPDSLDKGESDFYDIVGISAEQLEDCRWVILPSSAKHQARMVLTIVSGKTRLEVVTNRAEEVSTLLESNSVKELEALLETPLPEANPADMTLVPSLFFKPLDESLYTIVLDVNIPEAYQLVYKEIRVGPPSPPPPPSPIPPSNLSEWVKEQVEGVNLPQKQLVVSNWAKGIRKALSEKIQNPKLLREKIRVESAKALLSVTTEDVIDEWELGFDNPILTPRLKELLEGEPIETYYKVWEQVAEGFELIN